ncbi:helix-turn-helix domain-containing protein [Paenibacillus albicereus]|uniref:Helix-turn-helix domain-containing protein n=1 Tax=Paenibacillus albicereus TaxID=2726185 RepID=A0A6H2GXV7_9BACL|nr:helix-turn-helix domain-containing protein [Paenibacillus albicereus]QJC52222.1 helix-turn-helix domain-containing protein [Paenibacillus albicereus]
MSELGQTLRTAREESGLSLDELQEMTKIRKHYLIAIEEGNYSALPGSFYARAFVKNYAEAVGLNAEEVLSYYKNELPSAPQTAAAEPATAPQPPRKASTSRTMSERFGKLGFSVLMWAFLGLIVFLLWMFVIRDDGTKSADSTDQTPLTTSTPGPNDSRPTASPGSGAIASPSPSPTPTPTPTPPAGAVTFDRKSGGVDYYFVTGQPTLQLKFSGGAWLEARKGGKSGDLLYNKNVTAEDTIEIPLDSIIYVNTGRADNTEFYIDGTLLEDGDRSGPKRFQFEPAADDAASSSDEADAANDSNE